MPIDVHQNSWLLPLQFEEYMEDFDPIKQQGLQVRIAHEVPVIFHQLNTAAWWYEGFEKRTCKELKEICKALGLQTSGSKQLLVAILSTYWRNRIRDGATSELNYNGVK